MSQRSYLVLASIFVFGSGFSDGLNHASLFHFSRIVHRFLAFFSGELEAAEFWSGIGYDLTRHFAFWFLVFGCWIIGATARIWILYGYRIWLGSLFWIWLCWFLGFRLSQIIHL